MHDLTYYLGTYSILIPIIIGIIVYNRIGFNYKLFIFYMIFGFCVDVFKSYIHSETISILTYWFYSITEIVFLSWFLKEITQQITLKKILRTAIPVFIIFWIVCYFILLPPGQRYSTLFDTISSIFITFISAIILLQFTQQNINLIKRPEFWIVGSIFLSFFFATFLFGLTNTELLNRIWFLYRIMTIVTNFVLVIGFLLFRQIQPTPN